MDKKRVAYISLGFGVLLLVIMAMLAWGGRRQTSEIILPESQTDTSGAGEDNPSSHLNIIAITPETVSSAISILARPTAYSRSQTVETFWKGGSGQSVSQVYVSGGQTRLDTTLPDGSVRHTLMEPAPSGEGSVVGVWYDDEKDWVRLESAGLTADAAGRMLSYETVRELPPETIALAEYRTAFGGNCIYVETHPNEDGYTDHYWVGVNGLLVAAERLLDSELIYRFTTGEPDISPQEAELFLLPDGRGLTES